MISDRGKLHPRDEIMQTMDRIYRYRMTTTSGGNLSIRDGEGKIWISPARVDKGNLTRGDIVCVDSDGSVDGLHPPSSEFPFHLAIYEARPDVRAIVHAHPVALVAFSICQKTPDTRLFHQAHTVCSNVGFAPYACPGSQALGESIAKTFAEGSDSVILENHGVVVGGSHLADAFQRFEAFEFAGKTLIKANHLGAVRLLDHSQLSEAANRGVEFASFEFAAATESADRFIRLHPRHPNVDYAFYMKGLAAYDIEPGFFSRFIPSDDTKRDISHIQIAFGEFSQLLSRYPDSAYAPDARQRMIHMRNMLARHEIHVANYYFRRGAYMAALNRGKYVVEHMQQTPSVADGLAIMAQAYLLLDLNDLAEDSIGVLCENFPDHPNLKPGCVFDSVYTVDGLQRSWLNEISFGLIDPPDPPQFNYRPKS